MRVTRKDAEAQFQRLIKAIGGRVATSYNDVGAYTLDYVACYGGYGGFRVERIENSGGAVSTPFGDSRMTPTEFWHSVYFTLRVLSAKAEYAQAA